MSSGTNKGSVQMVPVIQNEYGQGSDRYSYSSALSQLYLGGANLCVNVIYFSLTRLDETISYEVNSN